MHRKLEEAKREEGFTLIELLVVVIIIGILAAIAIPVFLNQRRNAWQAELTSGVRNVALEIEAAGVTQGGSYDGLEADVDDLADGALGANHPLTFTADAADFTAQNFIICAEHDDLGGDASVTYDTSLGGIQPFDPEDGC